MKTETLEQANKLVQKIEAYRQALNCFEWSNGCGTTNPTLIIEYDGPDGRERQPVPMVLSNDLLLLLKKEIIEGHDYAVAQFNAL